MKAEPQAPTGPQKAAGIGCLAILILATLGIVKACSDDAALQQQAFSQSSAVTVEASDLEQAFNDNEIDAKKRYGAGKSIILTGTVSKIEGGSPAIATLDASLLSLGVQAIARDEGELAPLRPGQQVEFKCVGARKALAGVAVDSCNEVRIVSGS